MEYKEFNFEPHDGFLDSSFYEDTPSNSREILQRQHNQTRDYINSIINTLNSKSEGESGIESIKSPEIEGVEGNNAYLQIKDIKRQLNEVSLNNVPDASISNIKLANDSVTNEKIKDGEITTNKLSEDLCAPFSNDVKNINNIPSNKYLPIEKTGSLSMFKDIVCSTTLTGLTGKTHKGIRYVIEGGYLNFFDFNTKRTDRVSNISLLSTDQFFIDKNDNIYIVRYQNNSLGNGVINIYEYNTEYEELIFKNTITLITIIGNSCSLIGVDCNGEDVYVGIFNNSSSYNKKFDFHKISLNELFTITKSDPLNTFIGDGKTILLCAGEDVVFNDRLFVKGNNEDVITLPYVPYCYDNEIFYVYNNSICAFSKATLFPALISNSISLNNNSFVYNNTYYQVVNGYIVGLQLF